MRGRQAVCVVTARQEAGAGRTEHADVEPKESRIGRSSQHERPPKMIGSLDRRGRQREPEGQQAQLALFCSYVLSHGRSTMPVSKPLTRRATVAASSDPGRAPEAVIGPSRASGGSSGRSRAVEIAALERRLSGLQEQLTKLCRCSDLWQSRESVLGLQEITHGALHADIQTY